MKYIRVASPESICFLNFEEGIYLNVNFVSWDFLSYFPCAAGCYK